MKCCLNRSGHVAVHVHVCASERRDQIEDIAWNRKRNPRHNPAGLRYKPEVFLVWGDTNNKKSTKKKIYAQEPMERKLRLVCVTRQRLHEINGWINHKYLISENVLICCCLHKTAALSSHDAWYCPPLGRNNFEVWHLSTQLGHLLMWFSLWIHVHWVK